MSQRSAIDNEELLIGLILVVTSVVGLVGGKVALDKFNVEFTPPQERLAVAVLLVVGLLGIGMILRELFVN